MASQRKRKHLFESFDFLLSQITWIEDIFVGELQRNVKVCLSERDFPVGCQFKETFALNFLEAHRDLH